MRQLLFSVSGQTLRKEGDFSGIIAGSRQYLKCRFQTSDPDWRRAKKIALFNEKYPVAISQVDECMVPDEVTDAKSFKVRVIGEYNGTRMMTNPTLVEQVR